jgi:hypothetical protein
MSTHEVWEATAELAELWTSSPVVRKLLEGLSANNGDVAEAMLNLGGVIKSEPLLTHHWEGIARALPLVQVTNPVASYLRSIAPIGHAVEWSTAWFRSRLPLYPKISAPQFASSGQLRCQEGLFRVPWRSEHRQANLGQLDTPPISQWLKIADTAETQRAATALLSALVDTREWQVFEQLSKTLSDEDRDVLAAARRNISHALTPAAVDAFDSSDAARRAQFRTEKVAQIVAELSGTTKDLAIAFGQVNELIDLVTIDVLSQVVAFGPPLGLTDVYDLEASNQGVAFNYGGDEPVFGGKLVRLNDPLVPEVVHLDNATMTLVPGSDLQWGCAGRQLTGSQSAFGGNGSDTTST